MKGRKPTSVRLDASAKQILRDLCRQDKCSQSDVLTGLLRAAGVRQMRTAAKKSTPPAARTAEWKHVVRENARKPVKAGGVA